MATVTGHSVENLLIERKLQRKTFNKLLQKLDEELAKKTISKDNVLDQFSILEETAECLFLSDECLKEHLYSTLTEQEIEKEFDDIQYYKTNMIVYRRKCKAIESQIQEEKDSIKSRGDRRKRFQLPKIEFKKFDGNVKNWIGFWGQFKKIDEDEDIDLEDKFQYLIQATEPGTVARDLVESFPPCWVYAEERLGTSVTQFI